MKSRINTGVSARLLTAATAIALAFALVPAPVGAAEPTAAVEPAAAEPQTRTLEAPVADHAAAAAVSAQADADSNIAGAIDITTKAASFTGTLNASSDPDDVFAVTLASGEVLVATISGPTGSYFDLYLYDSTATDIAIESDQVWWSDAVGRSYAYPFELEFATGPGLDLGGAFGYAEGKTFAPGTYYLDAYAGDGSGTYTITWRIVPAVDPSGPGNEQIPGVSVVSPQAEWGSDLWDADDVYAVDLAVGDELVVSINSTDKNLVADAFLFRPNATNIFTDWFTAWSSYTTDTYPATLRYVVPPGGAGTYFVDVYSISYSGDYTFSATVLPDPSLVRLSGASRFDTAQVITRSSFASASVGVIATGMNYADALSAAGLAGAYDAPLLLVDKSALPDAVMYELMSLGVTDVFIVGGTGVVSTSIENTLRGLTPWLGMDPAPAFTVTRIAGRDRYETSRKVAEAVVARTAATSAFLVRGDGFADALAVSPLAYTQGMPILLTPPTTLNTHPRAVIENEDITQVYIAGGTSAVSAGVASAVRTLNAGTTTVQRIAGRNRYDTAATVAQFGADQGWNDFGFVGVATGTNFPDALAGGIGAGNWGGVLLLTDPKKLSAECSGAISRNSAASPKVAVFGGTGAVGTAVYNSLNALLP